MRGVLLWRRGERNLSSHFWDPMSPIIHLHVGLREEEYSYWESSSPNHMCICILGSSTSSRSLFKQTLIFSPLENSFILKISISQSANLKYTKFLSHSWFSIPHWEKKFNSSIIIPSKLEPIFFIKFKWLNHHNFTMYADLNPTHFWDFFK